MHSERIRKEEAETLSRALGKELGLTGLEEELKAAPPAFARSAATDRVGKYQRTNYAAR